MGLKLTYMGLKLTYMGPKLTYTGLKMNYMGLRTQGKLILFKGSARRKIRRRNGGWDKVAPEKGKEDHHQKHRSALRALKKRTRKQ